MWLHVLSHTIGLETVQRSTTVTRVEGILYVVARTCLHVSTVSKSAHHPGVLRLKDVTALSTVASPPRLISTPQL